MNSRHMDTAAWSCPWHEPRAQRGVSLVELMVALAIGSIMIIGAVTVYSNSRTTYAINESLGRLQEQGRYVMSVLEPDVELAGFYGFTNSADTIRYVRGADPSNVLATAAAMRQRPIPVAPPVPTPGLPGSAQTCGTNFAVDVLSPIQGSNDSFALGPARGACDPYGTGAVPNTDTLTIRRASADPTPVAAGRVQLYATRLRSRTSQQLFSDGVAPGPIDADNRIHNLLVRAYYVAQDSVDRPGLPALRVKALTAIAGAPGFIDTEVMPGVEDLQVQFGIDTGDYDNDGVIDPGSDVNNDGIPETDGHATRYVNADFPDLDRVQIVSVRVWVRVRSEQAENGFVDGRTYRYADVEYTPSAAERGFRRILLSRTFALRNARTL